MISAAAIPLSCRLADSLSPTDIHPAPGEAPKAPSALPVVRENGLPTGAAASPTASPSSSPAMANTSPPSPSPTAQPSPMLTLTPTATQPPPAVALNIPADVRVGVVLGTDYDSPYLGRTDTILLGFANPATGQASLISIPRDLYLYQPGWGMDRINTAFVRGGPDLFNQTIEYNLGVRPTSWALLHFDDYFHFINDLGGIDVFVSSPIKETCGGIPSGLVHMDGAVALCYVRQRQGSSDIERARRQLEMIPSIIERALSPEMLLQLPRFYFRYSATAQTNLTLEDVLGLVPFALRMKAGNGLHFYQIGWDQVSGWQDPSTKSSVLLPRPERIRSLLEISLKALEQPVPYSPFVETQIVELTPAAQSTLNAGRLPISSEAQTTDSASFPSPAP